MQNFTSCPRCGTANPPQIKFCTNVKCGLDLSRPYRPQKKQPGLLIALGVAGGMVALCAIGGLLSSGDKAPGPSTGANTASSTAPTPTPDPYAEAQGLVRENSTEEDLEKAKSALESIPKTSADYANAQTLLRRVVPDLADLKTIGPMPVNSPLNGTVAEVDAYLSMTLNDYHSAEYLEWSKVIKTKIGKEPYWAVKLKLRAKNAIGAFIVKDAIFYIRQGQVVNSIGM